jgi:hypothetical protein
MADCFAIIILDVTLDISARSLTNLRVFTPTMQSEDYFQIMIHLRGLGVRFQVVMTASVKVTFCLVIC